MYYRKSLKKLFLSLFNDLIISYAMSTDKDFRQVIAMYLVSVILVYIYCIYIFSKFLLYLLIYNECIMKKFLYNSTFAFMFMSLFSFLQAQSMLLK